MPSHHPGSHDVIIAGAGPVGLFLACELCLADLSVLVLEQAEHPHSPLKRLPFGLRGLSAPTVEAFYRCGLLDDIAASQPARDGGVPAGAHGMAQPHRPGGHFAGIQFFHDKIDVTKGPGACRVRRPAPSRSRLSISSRSSPRAQAPGGPRSDAAAASRASTRPTRA